MTGFDVTKFGVTASEAGAGCLRIIRQSNLEGHMKSLTLLVLFAASVATSGVVRAASVPEVKWILQCIDDNRNEGQSKDVVIQYCTCMNNQMSSDDTQSITEWEKSHETEANMCVKKSGWK